MVDPITIAKQSDFMWLDAEVAKFAPDKRAHFLYAISALVNCYQSDKQKGLVLICDGLTDTNEMRMLAINSTAQDTEDMIDQLCDLKGFSDGHVGIEPH